jgi:menaquinone-9 beta-reductase
MKSFDVAIVGAGPAGSSAAICLARKGYHVALIDKEQFPREKLCGDFLNPINWPVLRRLGVHQQILSTEHEKVTVFRLTSFSGGEVETPLLSANREASFGLGLRRSAFDQVLLEKAVTESAAVFHRFRIKELIKTDQAWCLTIDNSALGEKISARMLIGADGRNSWLAHRLGLAGPAAIEGRAIGFQVHLRASSAIESKVEIHLFPGGYAGLVGLGGRVLNLCFAIDKARFQHQRSFEELIESCLGLSRHLKQILCHSETIGEIRSIYPVYFPPRHSYGDRVLLVGDAARVSEPVTGEGVYFALRSGELAARRVDQAFEKSDFSADHLRLYERECRSAFQIRQGVNALLRWLIYRPALVSPFIRLTARRRRLLDALVQTICHPEAAR